MAQNIIRGDINYGLLVVAEIAGIRFVTEAHRAEKLRLTTLDDEDVPEFNTALCVETQFPNGLNTARHHVLDNRDVRWLGEALSKHTQMEVRVIAGARILARYKDGKLVGDIRQLDDFYSDLTADEINASRI